MRLVIQTPEKVLVDRDELSCIRLILADGGSIGIRPGHHPLIGETMGGKVQYGRETYEEEIEVQAGILHVEPDRVTLFTSGLMEQPPTTEQFHPSTHLRRLTQILGDRFG